MDIKIEKKKRQPGEPIVEIYGCIGGRRVPLPKIFVTDNGYTIQWSDGTTEFVPCVQPLNGVKEFVSNYVEGMLTFRFKPLLVISDDFATILSPVMKIPKKIEKSDKEILEKVSRAAQDMVG